MDLIRREIKFQIPERLVEPISDYISHFCELDKYSKISPQHYYTINSLYFDSDGMQLLETKRQNLPRRYSMRLRSYGESPGFPAFLEIKQRYDQFIQKKRSAITSWETVDFLRDGRSPQHNKDLEHPFMRKACYEIVRLGLKPRMMTQYRRKAYFGIFEPYSRITFDREMRCYPEAGYNIFPAERKFLNYDHDEQYVAQKSGVVLELKTELKIPRWMTDLIARFELRQSQFSKFDSSWTFLTESNIGPIGEGEFSPYASIPMRQSF